MTDPLRGLRAKRRHLLRKVTVVAPTEPATVLQFQPRQKEVTDGE